MRLRPMVAYLPSYPRITCNNYSLYTMPGKGCWLAPIYHAEEKSVQREYVVLPHQLIEVGHHLHIIPTGITQCINSVMYLRTELN